MKDNNTMRNMFSKIFPILLTLAMVISAMPSTIVSAETKTAGSLSYVDDGINEPYWVDRNGNVVVVPLQIILEKSEYEYTGKPIKPKISYMVGTGRDKVSSPRYDGYHYGTEWFNVTYKNNVNVGTGTVCVSDKGNNITITQDFTIKPSSDKTLLQQPLANYKVKIKKFSKATESFIVEWNNLNFKNVAYQVQYATNKKMKGAKNLRFKNYSATSTLIQSLKKNKTYYVRVRAYTTKGKKQSTKWSPVKKVKTLKKAKYYDYPYPVNTVVNEGNVIYWFHVSKWAYYYGPVWSRGKYITDKKEKQLIKLFQKQNNGYDGPISNGDVFKIKKDKNDKTLYGTFMCLSKDNYYKMFKKHLKVAKKKYTKYNPYLWGKLSK